MGKVLESHKGEPNPQRLVKVELLPPSAGGDKEREPGRRVISRRCLKRSPGFQSGDEEPAPGNPTGREPEE